MNRPNAPQPEDAPSDERLIALSQQRDAAAFGVLYERYLEPIYRYLYHRVGNQEEAEDLTEELFLRAWEALPAYTVRGVPWLAWLYRIAHNLVIDHYRTRPNTGDELGALELAAERADEPEQAVVRRQRDAQLARALAHLEPLQQEVLTLRFFMGYSHRETAELLGRSEGAVRVIQHRALQLLRRLIAD